MDRRQDDKEVHKDRNVGVVSSTGSVQAGSFSPQLPDPLESPTQADPPSDLSLPTSLRSCQLILR
jgi:hypothetical protein